MLYILMGVLLSGRKKLHIYEYCNRCAMRNLFAGHVCVLYSCRWSQPITSLHGLGLTLD